MEEKISKVFNILEVEEHHANMLLETDVCILLGCRTEKYGENDTKFIYSIGQYDYDEIDFARKVEYYTEYNIETNAEDLMYKGISDSGTALYFRY